MLLGSYIVVTLFLTLWEINFFTPLFLRPVIFLFIFAYGYFFPLAHCKKSEGLFFVMCVLVSIFCAIIKSVLKAHILKKCSEDPRKSIISGQFIISDKRSMKNKSYLDVFINLICLLSSILYAITKLISKTEDPQKSVIGDQFVISDKHSVGSKGDICLWINLTGIVFYFFGIPFYFLVLIVSVGNVAFSVVLSQVIVAVVTVVFLSFLWWQTSLRLCDEFRKDELFFWGLFLVWPIFLPILAFDKSKYSPSEKCLSTENDNFDGDDNFIEKNKSDEK